MEFWTAHGGIILGRKQGENDRSFNEFLAAENNRTHQDKEFRAHKHY